MTRLRDTWFIRMPNGQEFKASGKRAVVHNVRNGTIPRNSWVRRSADAEWVLLEWSPEFSASVKEPTPPDTTSRTDSHSDIALHGVAARHDPLKLNTVGVRWLWDDLIAAVDSTFVKSKLLLAGLAATAVGALLSVLPILLAAVSAWLGSAVVWSGGLVWAITLVASTLVVGGLYGLLTRMTHIELSHMRPATLQECTRGLYPLAFRLVLAILLVVGSTALLIIGMRWLPGFLGSRLATWGAGEGMIEVVQSIASVLGVVVEVMGWIIITLSGMLAPILVVEETSVVGAWKAWGRMLRDQFAKVLLAEILTVAMGLLITLPFAIPVGLAMYGRSFGPESVSDVVHTIGWAVAATPLLTFVAVANVFIYLELRYEQG